MWDASSGVAGMGAQSQTSFPSRHKTYMNHHPADLEWSGTHRQLSQGWGGNALAWDRGHMTPLTWNGLVAEGVSADALVTWQTPEHLGEKGGPGCPGRSWRSNFFFSFSLWPGISLNIYNFLIHFWMLPRKALQKNQVIWTFWRLISQRAILGLFVSFHRTSAIPYNCNLYHCLLKMTLLQPPSK